MNPGMPTRHCIVRSMGAKVTIKRGDRKFKRSMMKNARKAQQASLDVNQSDAVANAPSNVGQLRQTIYVSLEGEDDNLHGTVYTDTEHGWYVEFGTGPVGAANHDGISPEVPVSYSMKGWLIPGDAISEADAMKYKFKKVTFRDGSIWWATNGQPAQPFMYPAFMNSEKAVNAIFSKALSDAMKEASVK